ncbi:MAG: nitroreductase family deazaflavin-dependent oxidoreductase [Candidatus Dormibacteria bacterium]
MSPDSDPNLGVIAEFRSHGGKVGGPFEGAPVLLLHDRGARSGAERVHPVMYLPDGQRYIVFASKGGAPTNPDWYHNLKAHPEVSVEVGSDQVEVTAAELTGEERDRLFRRQATRYPQFDGYQAQTKRLIPVVALTPRRS